MTMKAVLYSRVSTSKQGQSGLGLEAQRKACLEYVSSRDGSVVAEFVEVESGKNDNRVELAKAMHSARVRGAVLVIAKLDRLSRDASFLFQLAKSNVEIVALDCPDMNTVSVGFRAVFAQHEREATSTRTKVALAAAKARGVHLGNPNISELGKATNAKARAAASKAITSKADAFAAEMAPVIEELQAQGHTSLNALARALTAEGFRTSRGGTKWYPVTVKALLERIAAQQVPTLSQAA